MGAENAIQGLGCAGKLLGPRSMRHTIRGEGVGQGNGQADGRELEGHAAIGKIVVGEDAVRGHVRETGKEPGNARTVRHRLGRVLENSEIHERRAHRDWGIHYQDLEHNSSGDCVVIRGS